jgi:hypothetical protein
MIKMLKVLGVGLVLSTLFASGCTSLLYPLGQQAKSTWPGPTGITWYWYRTEMLSSAEEAMGTLKNLQRSFVEFTAGQDFKTFDLDKYGLRTTWEWTETTQYTQYVPNSGGYWIGYHYVPYYGGSYQPSTSTTQHNGALVIPFAEVSSLAIFNSPNIPVTWKWGLEVSLEGKAPIYLRAPDEKTVRQLGNIIATLSREQGRIIKFSSWGFGVAPLTPEQSTELALQPGTGLLIYWVSVGSPVEKVGLRFLDVILEEDGQPVKDVNELVAPAGKKKSVNLKILRREKITDAARKTSLQKTELSFPVNLEE